MSSDLRAARRFRPDIEGLRGVAVALVVLYHAGAGWFPGGYIGVDVFFVISGFLITGLLLDELQTSGTVAISAFYARRARRLLPAGILVLIVTLIAAKFLLAPLYMADLANDAKATALYASNIRFAVTSTDYLRAGDVPSAVLHYWSLAVEEQFYLLWPLIMFGTYRAARSKRAMGLAIAFLGLASLAFCVRLTYDTQSWAFFSLPTRAWELAAGALLALTATRLSLLSWKYAAAIGWAGLAAIVSSAALFNEETLFPGWAAILPVAGAAAVIAAGMSQPQKGASTLLEVKPLVACGRISYSFYLWHWPFLLIPSLMTSEPLSSPARFGLVAAALIVSSVTYRFVEKPMHRVHRSSRHHGDLS